MQVVEVFPPDPVAEGPDCREVVAGAAGEPGEQLDGRPGREHEREQGQRERHVGLAQALDALLHAQDHRCQRDRRDGRDQQHFGRVGRRNPEQVVQPGRQLLDAQAERRRQPEDRGEHGEDVHDVAEPAPHPIPEHRVERRSQAHRQSEVVGGEGEGERRHRVDGPPVEAPVVDGGGDRQALDGRGVRGGDSERRVPEVGDRFRHPEEHQADPDAGREQHREPRPIGVLRPRVWTAQADPAEGRCQKRQAEQHEDVGGGHEHPVERRGQPRIEGVEETRRGVPEHERSGHERDDGEAGDDEDGVVDVQAEGPDVVAADQDRGTRRNLSMAVARRRPSHLHLQTCRVNICHIGRREEPSSGSAAAARGV